MVHVADVERSADFYRLLGFEIGNREPQAGTPHWVWLSMLGAPEWRRGANLMLTRTDRPLHPEAQDVLFYLYANDLVALRETLIANGVKCSAITYPPYLPKGEFQMQDLDGYCLMIAQASDDTP